jgi:phenylalanine-4-hydroxylase
LPTNNKSPDFTTPVKFVIVTSWEQAPQHTLLNKRFRMSIGIADHNFLAGSVKLGMDSMFMSEV